MIRLFYLQDGIGLLVVCNLMGVFDYVRMIYSYNDLFEGEMDLDFICFSIVYDEEDVIFLIWKVF